MKPYIADINELAVALDMSVQNLYAHWLKKPGWPKKVKAGWPVKRCISFMLEDKKRIAASRGWLPSDLKQRKNALECDILQAKLNEIERTTIPIVEHEKSIDEMTGIFTGALDEWVQKVAAERRDAELLIWAKGIRDKARLRMQALCEKAITSESAD